MEQIKKQKKRKLQTIFIRFTLSFCVMTLLLMAVIFTPFFWAIASGWIWPANQVEAQIAEAKPKIIAAEEISSQLIPELCQYALFTPEGRYLSGSLTEETATKAWQVATGQRSGSGYYYAVIERENEICILRYMITPTFKSSVLRRMFPQIELTLLVLFILCFIAGTAILAFRFGRQLSVKVQGLLEATERIQQQDLDFPIQTSGIEEIDQVLLSLDQMKTALKTALQQQWTLEQTKKEQISALAHDIKTPVTIIRGNAELLGETMQDETQQEYTQYILNNASQIEKYTRQLIDVSQLQDHFSLTFAWVDALAFLQDIERQMQALAGIKQITAQLEVHNMPERLYLSADYFARAIINVLDNAVDHTPCGGKIVFTAQADKEQLTFSISDSGEGFSETELKEATKQFYMRDASRAANHHYGMGLYIADTIVQQHGGKLLLANSPLTGGGKVTFTLPKKSLIP